MMDELKTYGARVLFPAINGTGNLIMKADHERIVSEMRDEIEKLRTTPEGFALVPVEWTDEQQESAQNLLDTLRSSLGTAMSDTTMIGCIYDGMTAPYRNIKAPPPKSEPL